MAGFKPIRAIILSIFLPTFANATTKISQGNISVPLGTTSMADNKSFRKTTLKTIIKHMLANILTQPLNMSAVLLLPPIENASGESRVKTPTSTYLSPISKNSLMICTMRIMATIIASSQLASPGTLKRDSSIVGTST